MNESSNQNCCVIELRFCLKDNSHSMDAFIFNECEREFLAIVREISRRFGVEVEIEKRALGQGGLRVCHEITAKKSKVKNKEIKRVLLWFILICATKFCSGASEELGKKSVDIIYDKVEIITEEEKNQIIELNDKLTKILEWIDEQEYSNNENLMLKKKRSNYYEYLNSCEKVNAVIFSISDKMGTGIPPFEVKCTDFAKFIMSEYELEPVVDKNAIIENVTRIRNGRKYNWRGRYNRRRSIRFNFKDEEQNEHNHFDEGSSIKCQLEIHRKIGNGGRVRNEYEVTHVVDFQY